MDEARAAVEDVAGEGPIAFPELTDSLSPLPGIDEADAAALARNVLREHLRAGRLRIHRGRALDEDLPRQGAAAAASLVEDEGSYRYGDGDEVRAWFSLDPA